jgi:hypothetical protein
MSDEQNPEFTVIKPGSKEWADALNTVDQLENVGAFEGATPTKVEFDKQSIKVKNKYTLYLKSAVHHVRPGICKIILLFENIATAEMEIVSGILYRATTQLDIEGSYAEAAVSELLRNQLDYVLFEVPTIRANMVRRYLIEQVQEALGELKR